MTIVEKHTDFYIVSNNTKYGLYDNTGQLLLDVIYDDISYFNNIKFFCLKLNGKYAFYDKDLIKLTDYVYSDITQIFNCYFKVYENDISYIYNVNTKIKLYCDIDTIEDEKYNNFIIKYNDKYGLISNTGEILLTTKYNDIYLLSDTNCIIKDSEFVYIYDYIKKVKLSEYFLKIYIHKSKLDEIDTFIGVLFDNTEVYIDKNGNRLFNTIFKEIFYFKKLYAIVKLNNDKFSIINREGKLLLNTNIEFDDIFSYEYDKTGDIVFIIIKGDKFGVITAYGDIILSLNNSFDPNSFNVKHILDYELKNELITNIKLYKRNLKLTKLCK
jgi:hypothetical protein